MPEFTRRDKAAMLKRLVKRLERWEFDKTLGMRFMFGAPDISPSAPIFVEWRKNALDAIVLIFGENSHYIGDFNEVEYSSLYTALLLDKKEAKKQFWQGLSSAKKLLQEMIKEIEQEPGSLASRAARADKMRQASDRAVFLGHGRNPLWLAVRSFLENDCGLEVVCFESKTRTSESIVSIVESMLEQASFAVIVMTAEDATADGQMRARENVVHEAGLSQGKLGFNRVVILRQEGVEVPSNLAGLQCLSFNDSKVSQAFYDLGLFLKDAN
ncbi:MAG TPA: nucleotide-binding protein [Pyrinomonadaceae bacterium]|nr:nucleotide-binding protein [Pyrinomonadaceae bacterium]